MADFSNVDWHTVNVMPRLGKSSPYPGNWWADPNTIKDITNDVTDFRNGAIRSAYIAIRGLLDQVDPLASHHVWDHENKDRYGTVEHAQFALEYLRRALPDIREKLDKQIC